MTDNLNEWKGKYDGSLGRLKESLMKFVRENGDLRDRLKILFKEQGVTIVSILTALSAVIAAIIEGVKAATITTITTTTPQPTPHDKKNIVKKLLENVRDGLLWLGKKFGDALPGLLGSLFAFIFKSAAKVVGFLSREMWVLFLAVGAVVGKIVYDRYLSSK